MNKNQAIHYDYLIVGQGLAGSALAIHLLKRNRKFMVIDLPDKNVSSSVAAGLYNPITGKNWVKTWKADQLFPYMRSFYQEAERMLDSKFFHDKIIYRPFSVLSEQNDWMGKYEDPQYRNFIDQISTEPIDTDIINNPHGGLSICLGGNLNTTNYVNQVRKLLIEVDSYREEFFDFEEVRDIEKTLLYKDLEFDRIIFCQGPGSGTKKLWDFLPFYDVKGEILTISVKDQIEKIYNRGVFVLPLDGMKCKVGSTYDRINIEKGPTKSGKKELIDKLEVFFKPGYEIIDQISGIRPTTIDRKPFLGMHPNNKKLVIFNGLGAKGVTLAPFFANHLIENLENDRFLMKEVGIERFFK